MKANNAATQAASAQSENRVSTASPSVASPASNSLTVTAPASEAAILARVGAKEKLVDPNYYPGIKKAPGIVKVKLANVESRDAGAADAARPHVVKVKTADIVDYLIGLATIANPQW